MICLKCMLKAFLHMDQNLKNLLNDVKGGR